MGPVFIRSPEVLALPSNSRQQAQTKADEMVDVAMLLSLADTYHLAADWVVLSLLLASVWSNGAWRLIAAFISYSMASFVPALGGPEIPTKKQPRGGCVFVTGADSGMGEATTIHLANRGYHVFAGAFLKDSGSKLEAATPKGSITVIELDVTSDDSVKKASQKVAEDAHFKETGLFGIINCAGVGYNGPAEFFPMSMYQHQMDVNFFGYVRVTQALLPLMRKSVSSNKSRRGRVVFVGTGGGICSPTPPLLSAYMASKFAIEAFCGVLRNELSLKKQPIDCCMVNPGFVKPTGLMAGGLKLTERMWATCEKEIGSSQAKDEYGQLLETFIAYSAAQPGTHVSEVAKAMEKAMIAHRPSPSYKVGPDSQAAPVVGLLPRGISEFIVKLSMYGDSGSS